MDLHKIKTKIEKSTTDWREILPKKYGEELGERYKDINILSSQK
jgi:hypothetical protein